MDVANRDTSVQTAPLPNNSPTSTTEVGVTGGEAEAGAEDAHIRQEEDGMPQILGHPEADPLNSPLAT